MGKKFFPSDFVLIDATRDYDKLKVQYRVGYGKEEWHDGKYRDVYKVQMVYDGRVSGRQSPSYMHGTEDYEKVHAALTELMKKYG